MSYDELSHHGHWYFKGVQFFNQLLTQNQLQSFQGLRWAFHISSHIFLQYLQLWDILSVQAKLTNMSLIRTPLIDSLTNTLDRKGFISSLYWSLLNKSQVNLYILGRTGCGKYIGELNREMRLLVLEQVLLVSPLTIHRLSHIFVIHRAYGTIGSVLTALSVGPLPPADLLHMLWHCSKLVCYWHLIIETISVMIIQIEIMICYHVY